MSELMILNSPQLPAVPRFRPKRKASLTRHDESITTEMSKLLAGKQPIPPKREEPFPYYISGAIRERHEELFTRIVDLLLKKGLFFNSEDARKEAPFRFETPEDLQALMDLSLGSTSMLSPDDPRAGIDEIMGIMEFLIDYSPHASHSFMVSKNFAGLDPYGIVGDWLSTTMSHSVTTYILSPVGTLMEYEVEEKFRNLLGYPANQGDGMVVPGQGSGNSYVIQMALQKKFPQVKHRGVYESNTKAAMFVSDQADCSFEHFAIWQGIGEKAVVRVKSDARGCMDMEALKESISAKKRAGFVPFLIVGTAGTHVLGAIDPLDEIADVASKEKAWFHVDGHLAGSCVLSETHRHRLNGVERSDSCLWGPEKMLAAPFSMNVLVTKENRRLGDTFSTHAQYVFEQCTCYDHGKWDNGDNTMQCTRRPDILKIWFMWKAKGRKGLGDQVDATYENTRICVDELKRRLGRFVTLMDEFDSNLVSFYHIPEPVRSKLETPERMVEFLKDHKITETIKNRLLEAGKMEISIGELPEREDLPKFFVMNLNNTALTRNDIVYMLDLIEYCSDGIFTLGPIKAVGDWRSEKVFAEMAEYEVDRVEPTIPDPPESYPDYVSAPIESMHRELFVEYFKLTFGVGTSFQEKRDEAPYNFREPEKLLKSFDFTLQDTGDGDGPSGYKDVTTLINIVRDIMYFSPHLGHPYFIFQLCTGLDPFTMMADYVVTCMTSPMYTYEDAPVYTLMESNVTKAVINRAGFNTGTGLSTTGGPTGNQVAILLSYIKKSPETKRDGNFGVGAPGVIFCSELAHYSTPKGSFYQGTGLENLILVKADGRGKMDVKDLVHQIEVAKHNGKVPMMVCATAGTTQLGAYDPIEAIADVCEEYHLWLHIDGSYGGSVIMSDNQVFRLNGLERADSFTMNPHRMFCAARYTTVWTSKHKDILRKAAPSPSKQFYRLNPDLYNGELYDHGEFDPLTGKRPDVFKFWLLWKVKGREGLQAHVDRVYRLTDYAQKKVEKLAKATGRFQPLIQTPPECTNINFLYIPPAVQKMTPGSAFYRQSLTDAQKTILGKLVKKNQAVTSVEGLGDFPEHVIMCLYNSCTTEADVDYILDLMDYHGERLHLDQLSEKYERTKAG